MGKYNYNVMVNPEDAARRLGMSRESLYQCMRHNTFPFPIGIAIKKDGNKNYSYFIYEAKLEKLEQFWGLVD